MSGPSTPAPSRIPADTAFVVVVALLILAVQIFSERPIYPTQNIGLPMVNSGDEPHYLVLINSLLLDGDLDLKNNYFAVHGGANQAGVKFKGSMIDHHTTWYLNGERKVWREIFNPAIWTWPRDARGQLMSQVIAGVPPEIATGPEYSAHPIGIALLLAPLLFPFRGTDWLEPVAVFLAGIATVLAMLIYRRWLYRFTSNDETVRLAVIAVFLASPIWFYSRGFFNEPFLVLTVIGLFALTLEPDRAGWGGLFLAAGMMMKPQLALCGAPLGAWLLWKRRWKDAAVFAAAPTAVVVLLLILNQQMYGSWARGPYPFYKGSIYDGFVGLWTAPNRGVLWFWPVVAFAIVGWPALFKKAKWDAVFPFVGFALVLFLTSWWKYWDGGSCFGPRLLVPVLPLLGLGLVGALDAKWLSRFSPRWFLYAFLLIGILINGIGVTRYWTTLNLTPAQYVLPALFTPG